MLYLTFVTYRRNESTIFGSNKTMNNLPKLKTILGFCVQLHPIALYLLGYLDAKESFLVLGVSYLIYALFIQVKMGYAFVFDLTRLQFPKKKNAFEKTTSALGYFVGYCIVLFIWLFLYLFFFALMYDAIARGIDYDAPTIWEGSSGSLLIRTLIINGLFFLISDAIDFWKYVKAYKLEHHDMMRSIFLNLQLQTGNKWTMIPIFWFLFFWALFIFLVTAMAFEWAIVSFLFFDIGFSYLKMLEKKKNDFY